MTAILSPDGRYRYTLERALAPLYPPTNPPFSLLAIGVNPSTADAELDDATVRKLRGFASRWGFSTLLLGNLFAYRATDVRELADAADPVGPDNDAHLLTLFARATLVVPCWGSRDKLPPRLHARIDAVRYLLRTRYAGGCRVLGLTSSRDPRHPLMLGYATKLEVWSP